MRTAVFPGSFDPFTVGHFDVLESALQLFDKVIIAVGYNSSKTGFFSPDTRVEIIRQATAHMDNVEVCTYTGLTIDLCHQLGVNNIIRGLRTTTDFEMDQDQMILKDSTGNIIALLKKIAPQALEN